MKNKKLFIALRAAALVGLIASIVLVLIQGEDSPLSGVLPVVYLVTALLMAASCIVNPYAVRANGKKRVSAFVFFGGWLLGAVAFGLLLGAVLSQGGDAGTTLGLVIYGIIALYGADAVLAAGLIILIIERILKRRGSKE